MTDTIELIDKILAELKKAGGVEACAAVSRDGLLIRSSLQKEKFAESFAAMSATMLGAAETASLELGNGVPNRVIVESSEGRLIAVGAGPKALLVVVVSKEAGLGLMLLELDKAAINLKELLK
jgi:predicted regulator of Ras-like GTPase activity (Roadblock/LC7/MglB family)